MRLLHAEVAVPRLLPAERWSLTPPFHPYRTRGLKFLTAAVYSLLPYRHLLRGAQQLTGALLCEARTFLPRSAFSRENIPESVLTGGDCPTQYIWCQGSESNRHLQLFRLALSPHQLPRRISCGDLQSPAPIFADGPRTDLPRR
jgi:hypothetical protein